MAGQFQIRKYLERAAFFLSSEAFSEIFILKIYNTYF